jgi:hypothetical protein
MKSFSLILATGMALSVLPALHAGVVIPTSSCAPDFSVCSVYENQPTFFPGFPGGFIGAAGDVLIDGGTGTVAVFRVFNDIFDSGGGTGLGDFGFLYSANFYNLPDPASYSVNAVTVPLGPAVGAFNETVYIGGFGTEYDIFTLTPEPTTWAFVSTGIALLALRRRNRSVL